MKFIAGKYFDLRQFSFSFLPFKAMILHVAKSGRKEFLCNGVLVDQKRILTVAQCVEAFE